MSCSLYIYIFRHLRGHSNRSSGSVSNLSNLGMNVSSKFFLASEIQLKTVSQEEVKLLILLLNWILCLTKYEFHLHQLNMLRLIISNPYGYLVPNTEQSYNCRKCHRKDWTQQHHYWPRNMFRRQNSLHRLIILITTTSSFVTPKSTDDTGFLL